MYKYALFGIPLAFLLQALDARAEVTFPEACRAPMSKMAMASGMETPTPMSKPVDYQSSVMVGMAKMSKDMMAGTANADTDVAFICGMIAHHIGAVGMSELEQKFGSDPKAKALAEKIIAEQNTELEVMSKWVEEHVKR
jgi:uncharacterized protein (DUF305 family)